jgi:hypothetical protein
MLAETLAIFEHEIGSVIPAFTAQDGHPEQEPDPVAWLKSLHSSAPELVQ